MTALGGPFARSVAAACLCICTAGMAGSAVGPTKRIDFRPFDKTSVPLIQGLPPSASADDRALFSKLSQDDAQLLNCYLQDRSITAARQAAEHLTYSSLESDQDRDSVNGITNALFTPIIGAYYGKVDQADLWLSRYWGKGLFTSLLHAMPRTLKEIAQHDATPTSLEKEGIKAYFKNPNYAVIEYRSIPYSDQGPDGLILAVDADFVKFKETYAAAQQYCRNQNHTGEVAVVGWLRMCEKGDAYQNGLKTSGVRDETDTIMHVGFICK